MSEHYTLYLDETLIDDFFAIGGVIIKNTDEDSITDNLNILKRSLWARNPNATSIVLHEMEVGKAAHGRVRNADYNIFRSHSSQNKLYNGLSKIIKKYNLTTIGTCVDKLELHKLYNGENNSDFTIAIQMLLENYCHFLIQNNAEGIICYESVEGENKKIRQRFYEILTLGSLYYTSNCFQSHITGIIFVPKCDNNTGLQLADFIPNTHARSCKVLPAKHNDFKKTVFAHAYDGKLDKRPKYGLKIIP